MPYTAPTLLLYEQDEGRGMPAPFHNTREPDMWMCVSVVALGKTLTMWD